MSKHAAAIAILVLLMSSAGCSLSTHFDDFRPGDPSDAARDSGRRDAGTEDAAIDAAMPDDAETDAERLDVQRFDAPMIDGGPGGVLLEVMLDGDGAGSVSSDDALITCPSGACANPYDPDAATMVMLTALAEADTSDFAGWGGACTGTDPTCMVTMDMARMVTATFTRRRYMVTVTLSGDGSGTVIDGSGAINCDGTPDAVCTTEYPAGSMVTLSATTGPGSTFGGWSGACTGTGPCSFAILSDEAVGASFDRDRRSLSVTLAGSGTGGVVSMPAGIDCGTSCSASYTEGTTITLTANPASDSTFVGWSGTGGCTGTGTCTVTMDMSRMVTATFDLQRYTLTVNKSGTGAGSVISTMPLGTINCGTTCSTMQPHGFAILLSANAGTGSSFTGWSGGGCDPTTPTCLISLTSDTTVTASFALQSRDLTIAFAPSGDGTGTVTSSPAGISCTTGSGSGCGAPFDFGAMVTLTASPGIGSQFVQWSSGGCSGSSPSCSVTMNMARTVTAELRRNRYSVSVTKNGAGSGTVTGSGVSCGATCTTMIAHGDSIMLSAAADAGSTFGGWGGVCASAGASLTCMVPITAISMVTATFTLGTSVLTVTRNGNGRVVSSPAGIDCQTGGGTCGASFTSGQTITLTPTADTGYMFTGWGGACSGSGSCAVTMGTTPIGVTANFTPINHTLTVTRAGPGMAGGLVSSSPSGISCGTGCSAAYAFNTMVTLSASSSDGSAIFTGWSGAGVPASCTGTAPCTVTMDMARAVTANFSLRTWPLDVIREGGGTGGVTSVPAGISCAGVAPDCSETFTHGQNVVLTATPQSGSNFQSWTSGPCAGSSSTMCTVPMTMAQTVRARFELNTYVLSVSRVGQGSVTSTDMMINCGALSPSTCSATYPHGSSVTLNASPALGYRFAGWSGAGCSGTGPCVVSMTMANTVTATFVQQVTLSVDPGWVGGVPVYSSDGLVNCAGDGSLTGCSYTYDAGTTITLSHKMRAWMRFVSWNHASCPGIGDCTLTLSADVSLRPQIDVIGNLVWVTNREYAGDFGGLADADRICQEGAVNGQLPPGTYVAWLSDSTSSAYDRIDAWSGWVRPDGLPVAYSARDLALGMIRHTILLDELGNSIERAGTSLVWTGTHANGSAAADHCADWTSTATSGTAGDALHGSGSWTAMVERHNCATQAHLYCFGVNGTFMVPAPPSPPPDPGYMFVSSATFPAVFGGMSLGMMDSACQSEAGAAGLPASAAYLAYVSTPSASAASRVRYAGPFLRPDGWGIGDRAAIEAISRFTAPATYRANGSAYANQPGWADTAVWTGHLSSPTNPSNGMSSCMGWTSGMPTSTGIIGYPAGTSWDRWGSVPPAVSCNTSRPVYCIRGS